MDSYSLSLQKNNLTNLKTEINELVSYLEKIKGNIKSVGDIISKFYIINDEAGDKNKNKKNASNIDEIINMLEGSIMNSIDVEISRLTTLIEEQLELESEEDTNE